MVAVEEINGRPVNRSAIARDIPVDLAHVSRIFSGQARPSLPLALQIAEYFGVTVEELCRALGINGRKLRQAPVQLKKHGGSHGNDTGNADNTVRPDHAELGAD